MKSIKLMNKIASVGTDKFDRTVYEVSDAVENPDAIMVRSASLHEMEFNDNLLAIARCGAGVNNIPIDKCSEKGIVVFNTPGANANGVKELVICALILAARDVVGGIEWVKTLEGTSEIAKAVEKGKAAYVGNEIIGKKLGVIGLGAIGGMVANAALALGMDVVGCDPFISTKAAWSINPQVKMAESFEDIFKSCDYISIHVPATPQTKNMINANTIAMMKDGVRILNLARADLVNAQDIKQALIDKKVLKYVTDFPTDETVGAEGIINIPHLGASTYESEDNCAVMAADQLNDFLANGNIKNSVNYPNLSSPRNSKSRVCVMHKNDTSVLSNITAAFGKTNNVSNASKGDNSYTIIETDDAITNDALAKIMALDGVVKVLKF